MRTRSPCSGVLAGTLLCLAAPACMTTAETESPANPSAASRPIRITNGATLGALASHWVCVEGCANGSYVDYIGSEVRMALATDAGFRSKITWRYASYTYVSTCSGSWIASGNGESAIITTTACTGVLSYPNNPAIGGHDADAISPAAGCDTARGRGACAARRQVPLRARRRRRGVRGAPPRGD